MPLFHISIRPERHCYFGISLKSVVYEFGLSSALQVFTKCLSPVVAYLRLHGIMVFPYLDDWLLVAPSCTQSEKDISFTLSLLSTLGLQVARRNLSYSPLSRYLTGGGDSMPLVAVPFSQRTGY